jgi:hypothetical protein
MEKQIIYEGFLRLDSNGEEDDILYLDKNSSKSDEEFSYNKWDNNPLAEILECDIANKQVTVKYYISNKKLSLEKANDCFIRQLCGLADADYCMRYSEYTGYLWTDEEIKIGGHDLLKELKCYENDYLILIVDINN